MGKNILVMTGSPRRGGNSDLLAEALIRGAESRGHKIYKFEAAFNRVEGCKACLACWSKGRPCAHSDAFNGELAPSLERAEVLVFASPLYWFGFSAQLKAAIDKFFAYTVGACPKKLQIREAVLLMSAGDSGRQIFEGVIGSYRNMLSYLGWADRGVLAVPELHEKGEILATGMLDKAEELGASL